MGESTGRRRVLGRVGNDERVVERNFHDAAFAVLHATADISEVIGRWDVIDGIGEIVAKFSSEVKENKKEQTIQHNSHPGKNRRQECRRKNPSVPSNTVSPLLCYLA